MCICNSYSSRFMLFLQPCCSGRGQEGDSDVMLPAGHSCAQGLGQKHAATVEAVTTTGLLCNRPMRDDAVDVTRAALRTSLNGPSQRLETMGYRRQPQCHFLLPVRTLFEPELPYMDVGFIVVQSTLPMRGPRPPHLAATGCARPLVYNLCHCASWRWCALSLSCASCRFPRSRSVQCSPIALGRLCLAAEPASQHVKRDQL
ncbi:hypothetical protein BC834DRAFT_469258 [Gloeopeniophorella convolvens]|nr:hypothetical protein BC834DRAFT_469258 [Gloeopeniophorella convolvens]